MATLSSLRFHVNLDVGALTTAITRLVEANAAHRKRRALAKSERALTAKMAAAFRAEQKAFLSRLELLKPYFPPEVREIAQVVDFGPLFDEAALATLQAFTLPLDEFTAKALEAGMLGAVADLDVTTSFTLDHPAAVAYLRDHSVTQVTRIRQTTRETLRRILSQAAEDGWSYQETTKAIRRRYRHFSKERARNIAVFELGDAYEFSTMLVARDLQDGGIDVQKKWLSAEDARVRPEHQANQAQGFIPLDDAFQSGHQRPVTDPMCRCTLLTRRKPDE